LFILIDTTTTEDISKNNTIRRNIMMSSKKSEQTSFSHSKKNVIRGLHCARYGKLVQCIRGHLLDVFVDLREDSPTFLKLEGG